jgi:hypothetical protein
MTSPYGSAPDFFGKVTGAIQCSMVLYPVTFMASLVGCWGYIYPIPIQRVLELAKAIVELWVILLCSSHHMRLREY